MKTYFIKDEEDYETGESYLEDVPGGENYRFSQIKMDNRMTEFDMPNSDFLKHFANRSVPLGFIDESYSNNFENEDGVGYIIEQAIENAKDDKNTKAVNEIKNIINKIGIVAWYNKLLKYLDDTESWVKDYKDQVKKIVQKYKSLGITK